MWEEKRINGGERRNKTGTLGWWTERGDIPRSGCTKHVQDIFSGLSLAGGAREAKKCHCSKAVGFHLCAARGWLERVRAATGESHPWSRSVAQHTQKRSWSSFVACGQVHPGCYYGSVRVILQVMANIWYSCFNVVSRNLWINGKST